MACPSKRREGSALEEKSDSRGGYFSYPNTKSWSSICSVPQMVHQKFILFYQLASFGGLGVAAEEGGGGWVQASSSLQAGRKALRSM